MRRNMIWHPKKIYLQETNNEQEQKSHSNSFDRRKIAKEFEFVHSDVLIIIITLNRTGTVDRHNNDFGG